jgi:DNA-binding beta-propeller fold protein YncE
VRRAFLLIAFGAILAVTGHVPGVLADDAKPKEARLFEGDATAPEFPPGLQWLNSPAPLTLRQFRGKFVLLDFWTYCCINCMHLVPDLQRLEQKYSKELVVIGVHSAKFENEKQSSQILEAIVRYGIRHPVVNDDGLEVWKRYTIEGWPTLVLINPDGKIIGRLTDERAYASLDPILTKAVPYFAGKGRLHPGTVQWPLEEARRPDTLLAYPGKISADPARRRLIVSDSNHNRILITDTSGKLLEVIGSGSAGQADGPFDRAEFRHPQGTAIAGDQLYIADTENHEIRAADLARRTVTTLLGTGEQARAPITSGRGRAVPLNSPWDLVVSKAKLYIAMAGSHQLFVADLETSELRLLAGSGAEGLVNGSAQRAELAQPSGLTVDGDTIYFADSETSSIRSIGIASGSKVSTIVGKGLFEFGDVDGAAGKARLQHPLGITARDGLLYVADTYNSKIKVIDPGRRTSATLAGSGKKASANGSFEQAAFNEPGGLTWLDGKLYVADTNNQQVRVLDEAAKTVSSLPIRGLDTLVTHQIKRFSGRIVNLGEQPVNPVGPELLVEVRLPAGYKLNPEAPFFLQWESIDGSGSQSPAKLERRDGAQPQFPIRLAITSLSASTMIAIQTVTYYCIDTAAACYVDPVEARVTLVPAKDAPKLATIAIPVKDPSHRAH